MKGKLAEFYSVERGKKMKKQIETERKYIIEMPDTEKIRAMQDYTESEIEQTYLTAEKGKTHRIRRRAYPDRVEYIENIKTRISPMSVIEEEGEITPEGYSELSALIETGTAPVYKKRYTFSYGGYTLEIDVYPQWRRSAVLEVELESESVTPPLPVWIKVIREVTGDKAYSNHTMARSFPEELV